MNRKQAVFLVATLVTVAVLVGAAIWQGVREERGEEDGLQVVASFYPLAFFAEEIGRGHVSVRSLVPPNTELHAWEPSPSDILAADDADVLVYNGAGLDPWFEGDVLAAIDVGDAVVVETTHGLDLLGTGGGHGHDEGDHDHRGVDPHTWLSPHVAAGQAEAIYEALVEADPDHEADYTGAWNGLRQRLEALDARYLDELVGAEHDEVIVTHEAFGYLAHRYGFEQHGVVGLSADEQPSVSAIASLADLMVVHGIYTVFVDPVYSDEHARTLRTDVERETGEDVAILKLYFMTGEMDGLDYFGQQERNLENLKRGLGARGAGV